MIRNIFASLLLVTSLNAFAAPEATFDVKLTPAGDFTGKTADVNGFATVEGSKVKAENIKVALKNVSTGIKLRDQHTQKHLGTDKHPEAILVKGEGENGKGKGILKIKGVEKEVSGTYKVEGQEVAASFKIKLSDYGITGIKYMGVGVNDEVTVNVKVPVKSGGKAPASVRK